MTLEPDDIEQIAAALARHLRNHDLAGWGGTDAARLVDATTVARILSVERDWVYAHAHQLGAVRLGGPHGRLRFDLTTLRQQLAAPGASVQPASSFARQQAPRQGQRAGLDAVRRRRNDIASVQSRKRPGDARTSPARHRDS